MFELLREAYFSPAVFFHVFLRVPYLYTWQRRICAQIEQKVRAGEKNIKVVGRTNHGAGKDFLSAGLVLWWMYTRDEARALTLAPTWNGIEKLLWAEVGRLWNGSLMKELAWGKLLDTELHLSKGSFAVGLSADKPGKLEGQHSPTAAMRVVDEAKEIEPAWFEATEGLLNAPTSFDLWISTPSIEDGEFYKRDMDGDPAVIRAKVSVDDLIEDYRRHGYATLSNMEAWKAGRIKKWGEESAAYQSRCLANYIVDSEGTLFPASWIERAFKITFASEKDAEKWTALDPAGSVDGDENAIATVLHFPDGERISLGSPMACWHERDTMKSKGRLVNAATEAKASMRLDSIGLGKGVLDSAREDGHRVEEFRASDKPRDEKQFANKKAEVAWGFRKKLEKQNVAMSGVPEDLQQKVKGQLSAMRYEIKANGKIYVIDPADSPDLADAALIASATKHVNIVGLARVPMQGQR